MQSQEKPSTVLSYTAFSYYTDYFPSPSLFSYPYRAIDL